MKEITRKEIDGRPYSQLLIGEDADVHKNRGDSWQTHLWKSQHGDRVVRLEDGTPAGVLVESMVAPFSDSTRKSLELAKSKQGVQPGVASIGVLWASEELRDAAKTKGAITIADDGTIYLVGVVQ